jgi:hypothetical protein
MYLIAPAIRETLTQASKVFHHPGRHVGPQLEHHAEGNVVVHLNLVTEISNISRDTSYPNAVYVIG